MTLQQALSSPDEEWAVLSPRIDKVIAAMNDLAAASGNQRGGGFGGGGGRGGRGGGAPIPVSVVTSGPTISSTLQELYTILNDPSASDEQVKAKLEAFRKAVKTVKTQLTQYQDELKGYLTLRQEAILMGLGYLE